LPLKNDLLTCLLFLLNLSLNDGDGTLKPIPSKLRKFTNQIEIYLGNMQVNTTKHSEINYSNDTHLDVINHYIKQYIEKSKDKEVCTIKNYLIQVKCIYIETADYVGRSSIQESEAYYRNELMQAINSSV